MSDEADLLADYSTPADTGATRAGTATVSKKIADTMAGELAESRAKLIMVRDLLAKKNATIDQLEADIDELRSSIPHDRLNREQQHTLADSIQRYRNRFDGTGESRITRKPRKVM